MHSQVRDRQFTFALTEHGALPRVSYICTVMMVAAAQHGSSWGDAYVKRSSGV